MVIVVEPTSVMERPPTPRKIRHPGVSIIGHHPISVSCIGMEIASYSRYPDIAVTTVSNPSAMRTQSIVENLNVYPAAIVVVIVVAIIVVIIVVIIIVVVITVISIITVLRISPALKSHTRC